MNPIFGSIFAGFVIATICSTIIGNTLVCLAVRRVRKLRQPPNALLVSLALADMFVGIMVMPLALIYTLQGEWNMGPTLCYLWTSADVTLCTASILNLCAISVDRYLVVSRPLTYAAGGRTMTRIGTYIFSVWTVALLISASPLLFFRTRVNGGQCEVSRNFFYQLYATFISFYLPTLVILAVNWRIYKAARRLRQQEELEQCFARATVVGANLAAGVTQMVKSGKKINSPEPNGNEPNGAYMNGAIPVKETATGSTWLHRSMSNLRRLCTSASLTTNKPGVKLPVRKQRQNKTLKTLGIITGCYIICWLPFFTLATYKAIANYIMGPTAFYIPAWLDWLCLWLGWINSFINPFIYAKFNREFRVPFKEMLCCRFSTLDVACRSEQYEHEFGNVPDQRGRNCDVKRVDKLLLDSAGHTEDKL